MSSSNPSPKMLKDFLRDDPPPSNSSVFSSFEAVLAKAFKAVTSRTKQTSNVLKHEAKSKATVVKIKDIVRWTSFRDLVEDAPSGPYGSECFATSVTGLTSSSCNTSSSGGSTSGGSTSDGSSNGSSWCESDFGEEFSPTWREFAGEKPKGVPAGLVEPEKTTKSFFTMETKGVSSFCDDKDQQDSPVSVIGFPFAEDENVSVEDLFQEDDVEDRARHILNLVELSNNSSIVFEPHVERLLLDFFTSELTCESTNDELERKAVDTARCWIEGELYEANEWGIGGRKDLYVTEMDEAGMWSGFEEGERMEMVLEAEANVFDELMKEVLVDCLEH